MKSIEDLRALFELPDRKEAKAKLDEWINTWVLDGEQQIVIPEDRLAGLAGPARQAVLALGGADLLMSLVDSLRTLPGSVRVQSGPAQGGAVLLRVGLTLLRAKPAPDDGREPSRVVVPFGKSV